MVDGMNGKVMLLCSSHDMLLESSRNWWCVCTCRYIRACKFLPRKMGNRQKWIANLSMVSEVTCVSRIISNRFLLSGSSLILELATRKNLDIYSVLYTCVVWNITALVMLIPPLLLWSKMSDYLLFWPESAPHMQLDTMPVQSSSFLARCDRVSLFRRSCVVAYPANPHYLIAHATWQTIVKNNTAIQHIR